MKLASFYPAIAKWRATRINQGILQPPAFLYIIYRDDHLFIYSFIEWKLASNHIYF
ncbi:hypothetical protein ABHN84_06030 [Shewanella vesiculosa]|uniref:Uncharacterized protein n=1 Tax=Shewanella vesiculosa TaxID=518738 RepID=A0ABV0FM00_9GAMM|nr:hypothetical protein [Shewanella sp. SR43-8]MBB1321736.1 hypothetical protein [Shewanella sp. SR43-8]